MSTNHKCTSKISIPSAIPNVFGLEMEYAGHDGHGNAVSNRDGLPLIEAFAKAVPESIQNEIARLGALKEEIFRHQREIVTHKGPLSEVLEHAKILHQIIEENMKAHLGVFIAESPAPLPFPLSENQGTPLGHQRETMDQVNDERALLGLVTPRDYYITSLKRVAATQPSDLSFAWNASTSSTHLHMSFDSGAGNEMHDRNQTLGLCAQLIAKNSLDIQDNPLERRKERGMSEERFAARSKIVATRAQLGEVLDPFGTVLIPTSSGLDIAQRLANRYFDGKHRNDPEAILENMAPTREHGAVAPKNPGGLTTEIRTGDGPGSKVNNINKPVDTYMNLVEKALQIQF